MVKTSHRYKAINLHEGLESSLMILQHRLKATANRPDITVIRDYGELSLIECYPGQFNQVVMNILAPGLACRLVTKSLQKSIKASSIAFLLQELGQNFSFTSHGVRENPNPTRTL